ncbi:hypothetical protein BD311DRAFT_769336 [Dichomitus squalens]|uniref:Uncharacterized protein n=1 Tax=Dichomitus squalens TaxID=114155 RepID=A0A4Q9MBA6_9APHY|nr:hypothetical protein BD311DRAFT_769336 [Dichomitus squalens]
MHIPIDTSLDDVMLTSFRCHAGGAQLLSHQSVPFIQSRVFSAPRVPRPARSSNIACALTQAADDYPDSTLRFAGTNGTKHRDNLLRISSDIALSNRPDCARLEHPQGESSTITVGTTERRAQLAMPVQRRQRSQSCSKTDNLPGTLPASRASTATEARFRCGRLDSVVRRRSSFEAAMEARPGLRLQYAVCVRSTLRPGWTGYILEIAK